MNVQRDPDEILAAWLDDGPLELPSGTRRAIVTALSTTPQARRGPFAPGRFQMIPFARFAAIATVVVVALGTAIVVLRPAPSTVSGPTASAPTPSTAASPSASPAQSSDSVLRTPSPLQGRATDFPVAFTYDLPADAGLVVDFHDPYKDFYQFRHPSGVDTYDGGVIVRAITGGRTNPCSASREHVDLADPAAFVAYFRTVPTMEVRDVTDTSVDGHPAKQMTLHFSAATAACPDVYLWTEDGSVSKNGGRSDLRVTLFDVGTHHIVVEVYGLAPQTADALIASLHFDATASPAPSG
jgi:hypothetical protein